MAEDSELKCQRCLQPLSAGNSFCVSCGFDNKDLAAKKFGVEQKSQRRIERAGLLSKVFRFLRFGR
jgi:hypothetical protein